MDTVLFHKFTQHRDLKRELLGTGDAELIEVRLSFLAPVCRTMKLLLLRTRTKIRSGGVGRMGRVRIILGKHLGDCVNVYVINKSGEISKAFPEVWVRRVRWDFTTLYDPLCVCTTIYWVLVPGEDRLGWSWVGRSLSISLTTHHHGRS